MLLNNVESDMKTFLKMMDELGYDVELTYKKKVSG
jgi:hypothetical protein